MTCQIMSKDVIELEKTEHVLIYKIVEQYKSIKRKSLIALVTKYYETIFGKKVSEDAVINWIREITKSKDSRSKLPALISKSGYYSINGEVKIEPGGMRGIWEEIDQYLKIYRENKIISDEIRVKHTEKIKERVVKPLIDWILSRNIAPPKDLMNDFLFEDLDNHIPIDLKNPKLILKEIDEANDELNRKEKEIKKDIENMVYEIIRNKNLRIAEMDKSIRGVGWIPTSISEILFKWLKSTRREEIDKVISTLENFLENSLKSIKCEQTSVNGEKFTSVFMPFLIYRGKEDQEIEKLVAELFKDIIKSGEMKKIIEDMKELVRLEDKIKDLKQEMLNVLRELEAYEILPGACKYISP